MSVVARSEAHIGATPVVDPEHTVTPKQLELLALYASGYSYGQIASVKFLSPFTVRNNLALALRRSNARNLTHLCVIMHERGMIKRNARGDYEPVQEDPRAA